MKNKPRINLILSVIIIILLAVGIWAILKNIENNNIFKNQIMMLNSLPVSFRVLDSHTGFEIKNYDFWVGNKLSTEKKKWLVGKTQTMEYLSFLPDGEYDYIISALGYGNISSSFNLPFARADSSGIDKIQVNMQLNNDSRKEWNLEWLNIDKEANQKGEEFVFGFISNQDYQSFQGVTISSDESSNIITTDPNGFFVYFFKTESESQCVTLHIKKDGYKEIRVVEYSSDQLNLRLQVGTGIVDMSGSYSCKEDQPLKSD